MDVLIQALELVTTPYVLLVIFLSAVFGLFMGAVPGLTATMATALLVPVTFFMDPVPAIGAIVTASGMAIFAGDIPAALLRIPGTPGSTAYVDDAFLLTKKGKAELCLGVNLCFSVAGGVVGTIVLVLAAPTLAEFVLEFGTFEYFWLALLGLTCAVFVSSASLAKGATSLLLGLLVSTVGLGAISGYPRFTFGVVDLMGGVNFIPTMIGMFAIPEVLRGLTANRTAMQPEVEKIGNVFRGILGTFREHWRNFVGGSVVGVIIGILPGAGSTLAAWVSYAFSKKFSKHPELYGTGYIQGIVASTSANNSAVSGAWVPALVFGIPGDAVTAIAIGVLYIKGMNPGPTIFINNPQLIYAVFIIFFLANLLMIPLGLVMIKSARQILRAPREVVMPTVLLFSIVGSFAINNTLFDVGVLLVAGVIAYFLEENGYPMAPAILGLLLGTPVEDNFMTSMIQSGGNLLAFFERPMAAMLGTFVILIWLSPLLVRGWRAWSARGSNPNV